MEEEKRMFHKKSISHLTYDTEKQRPVLRKSICTGETTAGFQDKDTKVYHDVMLIRDQRDLQDFMDTYGLTKTPETIY